MYIEYSIGNILLYAGQRDNAWSDFPTNFPESAKVIKVV